MTSIYLRKISAALVLLLTTTTLSLALPIDYHVEGIVPPIRQPNTMACWATVATMLYSWKSNSSYDIDTALAKIGSTYVKLFKSNNGLSADDKPGLLYTMHLKAEAPQDYTVNGWAGLLQKYGPVWVTTAVNQNRKWLVHARILTGITGDGTPDGTQLTIVDPADGAVHTESINTFTKKFDNVARADVAAGGDLRPQVVHY